MKLLLLGKNGQVGWELQRSLSALGELVALGSRDVDLLDLDGLRACVREHSPDILVNAAAYTTVDKAESEPERAYRVNAEAVAVLAQEIARIDGLLVHYSTDYVFDGRKLDPYVEEDTPSPINVYGSSKLEGERCIRETNVAHLIFRTSWVYGLHGSNFPKAILRRASEQGELRIVADQFGVPTSAELIADVTALAVHQWARSDGDRAEYQGTFHLVAAGRTNWHAYALQLLEFARARGVKLRACPEAIIPIPASEHPSPAARPRNSSLCTDKLSRQLGLDLPDWRQHLKRFVDDIAMIGESS
ncbi:MAG: dTDP-4-dehydrorhamnose reductase [Burkholderiales bacterium]|nr:dTDP-4-dehydrorhamnose reductase [Burkholderiales bacterium]